MPDVGIGDLAQFRWVFELAFVAYVVIISGFLVLERRRPAATLAWLFALVFLPVAGLLAYVLIGRRRVRRRQRVRDRRDLNPTDATRHMANIEESPENLPPHMAGLVRMAVHTAAAPLRHADSVEVLHDPGAAFEAMEKAIRGARHRIHLEFYIWRGDETGQRLIELLTERAKAGIKVRLLRDDFGSLGTKREHFRPLVEAGGEVAAFGRLRMRLRMARSRAQFRNHRKLLNVDGQIGFVGGINIANEYRGTDRRGRRWNDMLVRFDGDAVLSTEAIFLEDWLTATGELLELDTDLPPVDAQGVALREIPDTPVRSTGPMLQIIPSGPDVGLVATIATQFAGAIGSAQSRVWIATPYFVPDEPLTMLLRTAALRGVDVRILVPAAENNDSRLVALAARSYFDDLLRAGCRIFEFMPGMLHAKYMVIDDCVAAIGSANMDVRSFYINYEVTAMFYDLAVTRDVAEVFERDLSESREVGRAQRTHLPTAVRLAEAIARLLSPLL